MGNQKELCQKLCTEITVIADVTQRDKKITGDSEVKSSVLRAEM